MGTLPQEGGGIPAEPPVRRSFKDILANDTASSSLLFTPPDSSQGTDFAQAGKHKGFPAIAFSKPHVNRITASFKWALIGKFSKGYNKSDPSLGRPPVDKLYKYFESLDFHGSFQLGLLDNRHLLIQFRMQADFLHMYSRPVWYIKGIPMRIFKWSPNFHVDKEIPMAPVWISFPRLPVHFFERSSVFAIANLIGTPLRIDSATSSLKRPSTARVQIELDLLQVHPEKVWISVEGEDGFWQSVDYESIPDYCQHCYHIGHPASLCHVQHPELKNAPHHGVSHQHQKQQYVPRKAQAMQQLTGTPPTSDPHAADVIPSDGGGSGVPPEDVVHATADVSKVASDMRYHADPTIANVSAEATVTPASTTEELDTAHSPLAAPISQHQLPPTDFVTQHQGLVSVTPFPKAFAPPKQNVSLSKDVEVVIASTGLTTSTHSQQAPQPTASTRDPSMSLALVIPPTQNAHSGPANTQAGLQPATTQHINEELSQAVTQMVSLNPYALAFPAPRPLQESTFTDSMGYLDNDYCNDSFESDKIVDVDDNEDAGWSSAYDITDGSEGTIRQKRRDRRKSKAQSQTKSVTKEELREQSHLLGKSIKKRGRPPGSRNRTFLDVVRTMNTRNTKSTSD